ncbi:hypothetical protein CWI75_12280 [Kineobactrum sediminis]|uniref:Uncharacterized protein n=1 Tax=Kineobactrum sediminis TaxID=1905677 RepID=A0A2N5Y293_9GAMM|nr:hypothetical protein [Kineobactrum sediminis]PLW82520.1 hypothetical protein CWI75_12280 [Kineobactrum sediminis]
MGNQRKKNDLRAIGCDGKKDSPEATARIRHLKWLEKKGVLDRVLDVILSELEPEQGILGREALETEQDVLPVESLLHGSALIEGLRSAGMRLDDGTLTTPFLACYEKFCGYDHVSNIIDYSPATIERGDHPAWDILIGLEHPPQGQTTEENNDNRPAEKISVLTEATTRARHSGGQPGRVYVYNKVVDMIIDDILKGHPEISPADAWDRFYQRAPGWQDFYHQDDNTFAITFEPGPPGSRPPCLALSYWTTHFESRKTEYTKATFSRRLRKQRPR